MSNKILVFKTALLLWVMLLLKARQHSIDSRSLQNGVQTFFFALVGPNNDAHAYIKELIAVGVQNFVVTHIPEGCKGKFLCCRKYYACFTRICSQLSRFFNFLSSG
jgi:alanine racemase